VKRALGFSMMTLKPTCPHCGKLTLHESARDYIYGPEWDKCRECGGEYVISKNVTMKPGDYATERARKALAL